MNNLYKYCYYDKDQDKVIGGSWDESHKEVDSKVDPKFCGENFNTVKHDQFVLAYDDLNYEIAEACTQQIISTVCLPNDQDSIFMTLISSCINDYNGYQKRYTCLEEAKKGHDEIVLKIIRGEDL